MMIWVIFTLALNFSYLCLSYVDFSSIVRHSPNHGQWENVGPLLGIRVDLVKDQIGLDRVQIDLVRDQVVLVRD